jgi:hypothetical protein
MEHSPSWEANWISAFQEIPCISLNPNVHYCIHKRKKLHTYLLTYSMEHNPSWEVNHFSVCQEIPSISRNPKVHYCIHKRKKLHTYLLTHSMEHSPSWETNQFSACQEIPHISRIPNVHYRIHKRKKLHTYLLTYLLTPRSTVILEKLTSFQLVKKFPTFHGTLMFITAFTSARNFTLTYFLTHSM